MYKLAAVFIGLLIAIMVAINGILAGNTNDYLAILIIHLAGIITVTILMLITKKKIKITRDIPIYLFTAGAIGVLIVFFNNLSFKYLGVSLTLALGLFGQALASVAIDHFGLLGMQTHKFNSKKITGFILILTGIVIMLIGG